MEDIKRSIRVFKINGIKGYGSIEYNVRKAYENEIKNGERIKSALGGE